MRSTQWLVLGLVASAMAMATEQHHGGPLSAAFGLDVQATKV